MYKNRRTKIIATIGPASRDRKTMRALLKAGADVFRFNLKHSTTVEHLEDIRLAQDVIKKSGKKVGILLDFPEYNYVEGLEIAQEVNPDYIALSYIKNSREVDLVRENLQLARIKTNLVCKIETEESLKDFSRILATSDAIMIARGDLGRSISVEYVPVAQKEIIHFCNKNKKFVIVATEMLLSMTEEKEPTRAEAGDVANAVLDGTDAVMLSEETTIGKHPERSVDVMDRILKVSEYWMKKGHITIPASRGKKFNFGKD